MTVLEVAAYGAYLVPTMILFLRPVGPTRPIRGVDPAHRATPVQAA